MMRKRPRIAWVIPTMRVGGTEKQLLHLMRGLMHEFELTLICTRSEGALIGDARRIGAYVRVLDSASGWDFRQQRRIERIFHMHTPHILHSYLFGFDLFANRAARLADVPVVISSRRELATWQKRRHLFLQRSANKLVDAVVANSQAVAKYATAQERLDPALLHVIPNGIDADRLVSETPAPAIRARFKLPQEGHVIGMVANFSPVKDHWLFAEIANLLLKRRKDVHFLLVGTGELVPDVMSLISRRGQLANITRLATVTELPEVYKVCDLCLLTSKMEGFPNVIMEAMAAGRAIVAPAVGGIPELVQHEKTGLLLGSRQPKDFAAALEHLMEHREQREAMGAAGAAWVREHLTIPNMVERHLALYRELLQRKRLPEH